MKNIVGGEVGGKSSQFSTRRGLIKRNPYTHTHVYMYIYVNSPADCCNQLPPYPELNSHNPSRGSQGIPGRILT